METESVQGESHSCDEYDNLDIHAPEFVANPFPIYEQLREHCPVVHSNHYGGFWMLTRYDDVKQAVLDWRAFTSSVVGVTAIPIITPRSEPMLPIELDPPLHSRYRALVNPVFSPARIEALGPTVRQIAVECIEKIRAQGTSDLVTDYSNPVSVGTLAAFAGLPRDDSDKWIAWIRRMFDVRDRAEVERASREFGEYIDELIAVRHREPTGDFISMLIDSRVEGQRLTDNEIHSFCTVLFGAGFETTADALSVMLYYLAKHPEVHARLCAQRKLIPSAVEEFLRYVSPIQIFGRNASYDMTMHGRTIPKGDVVALSFGSANYDPAVFVEPERCIVERTPNPHLAFGAGIHLCLGGPVARLEMAVTLEEFLPRLNFAVAADDAVQWKTRGDRRGLATLRVTVD
jgi:cytochrome P450